MVQPEKKMDPVTRFVNKILGRRGKIRTKRNKRELLANKRRPLSDLYGLYKTSLIYSAGRPKNTSTEYPTGAGKFAPAKRAPIR